MHERAVQPARVLDSTLIDAEFNEAVLSQPLKAKKAWNELSMLLDERKIWFGSRRLPTSLKPHFIPHKLEDACAVAIEALDRRLEHLGRRLLEDKDLFETLRLPPGYRELFEIDPGYDRFSVICRPDMTIGPDGVSLYEVNTDSPAMLVFCDAIQELQSLVYPFADICETYQLESGRRASSLLDTIVQTYRDWGGTKEKPTIAIVDWADQKTQFEQEYTARFFTSLGYESITCTPHDLRVEGHRLMALGREIDIVQRRVLFPDFISRRSELEPLIKAYREHMACVVNPLRSYVLGNKGILALLWNARGGNWGMDLDSVLPRTEMIDDACRAKISSDPGRYVVKGCFSYGGKEVVIGLQADAATWASAIARSKDYPCICQEYCGPFRYTLPVLTPENEWCIDEFYGNWNPIILGGRFAGSVTRVSKEMLVGITACGALLPSIAV